MLMLPASSNALRGRLQALHAPITPYSAECVEGDSPKSASGIPHNPGPDGLEVPESASPIRGDRDRSLSDVWICEITDDRGTPRTPRGVGFRDRGRPSPAAQPPPPGRPRLPALPGRLVARPLPFQLFAKPLRALLRPPELLLQGQLLHLGGLEATLKAVQPGDHGLGLLP